MRILLILLVLLGTTASRTAAETPGECAQAQKLLNSSDVYTREEGLYQLSITAGCRGALGDDLLRICGEDVFYNADYAFQLLRSYYRPEQVKAGRKLLLANYTARLRDPDPRMRLEAAERLGKLKGVATEALPELLPACRDEDPYVSLAAVKAIRTIDGDDGTWYPTALRTLLEHSNGNVQLYALRNVAKRRQFDEQTLMLVRRLDDEELRKNVRRWKLKVLTMADPTTQAGGAETRLEVDDDGDE